MLESTLGVQATLPPQVTGAAPIDFSALRLSQNFGEQVAVKNRLITVPVRKPLKHDFSRVHPEWHLETAVLELKEERETYVVDRSLWGAIPGELVPKVLIPYVNRQKVLALWPIRLPGPDGRLDSWNLSAMEAATIAKSTWVRVVANQSLGAYEVLEARGEMPEPEWPEESFEAILNLAFKGRYIQSLDHPVLRNLRGE